MIYTFGSSLSKYYWPTWADWLELYKGPTSNLAYTGYDNQKIYWSIVDKLKDLTADDEIYIMWNGNLTMSFWYDAEWIKKHDCWGFFPNEQGELWYTGQTKWHGLYKQHPDHAVSFTHLLVSNLQCILDTQLLLDRMGCKYTMMWNLNPWVDIRPEYGENYKTIWNTIVNVKPEAVVAAARLLEFSPIRQLTQLIDWTKCLGVPADIGDLVNYDGIWEYTFDKKEYVALQNSNDMHPIPLAHHDYLLEKVLGLDPLTGKHRELAIQISKECSVMDIPKFRTTDYIATPDMVMSEFNLKRLTS